MSVDLEVSDKADITLSAVIDKVKRATAVDGEEVETESMTLDKFMEVRGVLQQQNSWR